MQHLLMLAILKIKEIAEKLGLIADYVVEQRTSGIWTYRKWNSGVAECWGAITWKSGNWIAWGNCYYSELYSPYTAFPFNFIQTPDVIAEYYPDSTDGWLGLNVNNKSTAEKLGRFYVIRPESATANADLCISVIAKGRWK